MPHSLALLKVIKRLINRKSIYQFDVKINLFKIKGYEMKQYVIPPLKTTWENNKYVNNVHA